MTQEYEHHNDAQHLHYFVTQIDQPTALIRTWTDDVSRTAGISTTTTVEWLHPLDDVGQLFHAPAALDKEDVEAVRAYHHEMVRKVQVRDLTPPR